MHMYFDTSNLNAPYDVYPPNISLGAGTLATGPLGSLGKQGLGEYPWREQSGETSELQRATNEVLTSHGYCPIDVDGKLGPRTCGAVNMAAALESQSVSMPAACNEHYAEWIAPSREPCGVRAQPPTTPTEPGTEELTRARVGGGGNWLLYGSLVAAAAIGVAIVAKKRRR
jgi:hypothetical protein